MSLRIGTLAERAGTNTPTIRYYESVGLLPRPDRRAGGQRAYGEDDVRRLTFIRRCRDFGFGVDQVRVLVELVQDRQRSCTEARDLAREHLQVVRGRLAELLELEASLAAFVAECEADCAGGAGPDCVVLADLADPARGAGRRIRT